jgi:hypothetical protein
MQLSLFGIILIILFIVYLLKNKNNPNLSKDFFFLSVLFLLVFDVGYFAKIGSFTIEYNYLFSMVNLVFALISIFSKKNNKQDFKIILILILFLFFSMIFPLIFNLKFSSVSFNDIWDYYFGTTKVLKDVGFSFHSVFMFIRTIIFILSFYVFARQVNKKDLIRYSKIIYNVSNVLILIMAFEFIISNFINESIFRNICFKLFGLSEATYYLPRLIAKNIYGPMLFMREPSSFARALFIISINNITLSKITKDNNKKIILNIVIILIALLFSKTLSSFIYIGCIFLVLLYLLKNKKLKRVLLLLIPLLIVVLLITMGDRVLTIFNGLRTFNKPPNELPQTSEIIRLYSIYNNITYFCRYFITGCGFGTIYSYSAVITILTNIGLLGSGLFIYYIYNLNSMITKTKKFSWFTLTIIILSHLLVGHLGYLLYLESAAYLYICLKLLDTYFDEKEVKSMKKIYVLCPYGLVTGGPDALHQLVYYLNNEGYDASIVYTDIKSYKHEIPIPYQLYIEKYLLLDDIEDDNSNAIIVPETINNVLNNYTKMEKYIWWLSVDNDLNSSGFKNKVKIILKKIKFKNLKKIYKLNTLKLFLQHKKFDFSSQEKIKHLCASYYAYDYVTKNSNSKKNIYLCIEPISKLFLDKSVFNDKNKEDIILYNPKKNFEFTKKILERVNDYKFIPLTGYTQDELINLYSRAKLYIDFGNFPGAERIPKEAVINGCCIITGTLGASKFYNDVPIDENYKFEAIDSSLNNITNKIYEIMDDYEGHIDNFENYRKTVLNLEGNFIKQLNQIFKRYKKK